MADSGLIYALLLGILQGIAEFLPISSSGHLIVVSWLLKGEPLPLTLNIALHVGTVLAVLVYFWRDWLGLVRATTVKLVHRRDSFEANVLLPALLIGSIPAGIIGVLWQDDIEEKLHHAPVVAATLAGVGILMWVVDHKAPKDHLINNRLTLKHALLIGIAQACALVPGVSRSGATITGARLLGYRRDEAARFSFLLGTPAMLGAALLNARDIVEGMADPVFYVGCLVAMVVGLLAIGFLLRFLQRFGLGAFAVYRLLLAGVVVFI